MDSSRSQRWVLFYNLLFIVYNFLDSPRDKCPPKGLGNQRSKYGVRAFLRAFGTVIATFRFRS